MSAANDFSRMILDFMRDDPLTAYYIKATTGAYDPSTGEVAVTTVEIPVQAILLDLIRTNNGLSSKFGTEILAGDKEVYVLPPEKADPLAIPLVVDTTSDRIRIGNTTYKIEVMKEANPSASAPLLYDLLIRR